jgi:hypothetical protein
MFRKFKSGYYHNNNIKYNKFEYGKTKMIRIELDENEKLRKINSKNIYRVAVSNSTMKELAHRDNHYKITNDDYYNDEDYNDYENY